MIPYTCDCLEKSHKDKYVPSKYLQRFISLNSASLMLEHKLFPSSNTLKEIAESMAMFYAVEQKIMKWDETIQRTDPNVNIVVVGDGTKPRTAALFALMTKWNCISIDPAFSQLEYPIKRLSLYKDVMENLNFHFENETTIIILPHSHASVEQSWYRIRSTRKWLVKMECCTHDKLDLPAYFYKDKYAITPANEVYIWNNYLNQ